MFESICFLITVKGKEVVDFISEYLNTIRSRRTFPDVQPGYMNKLVPEKAPEEPEKWEDIFQDVERVILPGVSQSLSPLHYHFISSIVSIGGTGAGQGGVSPQKRNLKNCYYNNNHNNVRFYQTEHW